MRDRLIELLCNVKCEGEECFGNCPHRIGQKCNKVQRLEMCSVFAIADHLLAEGVIVPPCKVGQTVYITLYPYTFLPLKKVVEGEVVSIHKHEFGLFIRVLFDTKKINGCVDYEKWTWGERLFFTREDAERALKEAQDDKQ